MKTLLTVLILFFFFLPAIAQNYKDLIILQSEDSLLCNIESVEGNSLLINSSIGTNVMLKVIKFIETKNENIINEVSLSVEGEIISSLNYFSRIDLTNATIPIIIKDETPFIKYKSISAYFGSQNPLRYGFTLFSEFPSLKNILACFEASVGVNKEYLLFRNFNIGLGVGTNYKVDLFTAEVFLKYYRMNLAAINYGTDLSKDFICTDFYLKYRFTQNSNYYLQLCYRFNFNDAELAGEPFQNIFTIGFGFSL
jgi:hypothetical protein